MTEGTDAGPWERKPQSLRFTLGDFCYWQFPFVAMVLDAPLSTVVDGTLEPAALLRDAPRRDADCFVIRTMAVEQELDRIVSDADFIRYAPAQYPRYFIRFDGSFQDYLTRFSAKSRSTWRRKVRKFADQAGGTIEWRQYRTPEEMREFHPVARELSRKTYQEKMFGEGFDSHAGSLDNLVSLAGRDLVRGYILFFRGAAVAFVYCPCKAGTILYGSLGYDPEHRSLSPGDVLLFLLIERLFNEGAFRYLDFGEGENWYKAFYATDSIRCARVYYFRRSAKHWIAITLHSCASTLTNLLGSALGALRLRDAVRRMFRRQATGSASSAPG